MAIVIDGNNTPTAGGIGYGDGTELAFTAAGTSGRPVVSGGAGAPTFRPYTLPAADGSANQILKTDGAGALSFTTASSGALVFLSSVTASASATVDVETTFSSTYDVYELIASGVVPSNDGEQFLMTMKIGGVYVGGSSYRFSRTGSLSTSNSYVGAANNAEYAIILGINVQNGASVPINFKVRIYNPSSTVLQKAVTWEGYYQDTLTPAVAMSFGSGSNNGTDALTGIRFAMGAGNITSGTFRLYGIANS